MHFLPESVEGGITLFFVVIAALIAGVAKVSKALEDWKRRKAARSVPPTAPYSQPTHDLARRLDTLERDVAMARQKWREDELTAELGRLQKRLAEALEDIAQLHTALAQERLRALRAERERDAARSMR